MKTCLVSLCYLEGFDALGSNRLLRNKRYLEYYSKLKDEFGFDEIILLDNHSNEMSKLMLEDFWNKLNPPCSMKIVSLFPHLGRGEGENNYPYCWRGLYHYEELMKDYDKIIYIDSDGFILTKRLAHFMRDLKSGWVSFWCETWQFPEAALHVLCKDAYPIVLDYFKTPWENRLGRLMEWDLPFTTVESQFKCGRYGETTRQIQDSSIDFYGQTPIYLPVTFDLSSR